MDEKVMNLMLNEKQARLLQVLGENEHQYLTIRDLQRLANFSSTSLVANHLKTLAMKGYVRRESAWRVIKKYDEGKFMDENDSCSNDDLQKISENLSRIMINLIKRQDISLICERVGFDVVNECIAYSLNSSYLFPEEQRKNMLLYFIADKVVKGTVFDDEEDDDKFVKIVTYLSIVFDYVNRIKMHFYPDLKNVLFCSFIKDSEMGIACVSDSIFGSIDLVINTVGIHDIISEPIEEFLKEQEKANG